MKALSELGISPWPWKARIECMHVPAVRTQDDDYLHSIMVHSSGEKGEADARLIAAAPELYEALLGCYITMEWLATHPDKTVSRIAHKHFDNVKAALAKASGEEAK